ncbi:MAG: hypothetical protein D8H99_35515 [Streptococcus sp.]|nr:MAG: hypothetical protein D8H99_35515 [Streptococcus sp.]
MTLFIFILFLITTISTVIAPKVLEKKPLATQLKVYLALSLLDMVLIIVFFVRYLLFTTR